MCFTSQYCYWCIKKRLVFANKFGEEACRAGWWPIISGVGTYHHPNIDYLLAELGAAASIWVTQHLTMLLLVGFLRIHPHLIVHSPLMLVVDRSWMILVFY